MPWASLPNGQNKRPEGGVVKPMQGLRPDSSPAAEITVRAALAGDDDDETLAVVRGGADESRHRGLGFFQGAAVEIEPALDRHPAFGEALRRAPVDAGAGAERKRRGRYTAGHRGLLRRPRRFFRLRMTRGR